MRCSCKICGTYMVQNEKGLDSGCICPECFSKCSDCMGSIVKPMSPDDIKHMLEEAAIETAHASEQEINDEYTR